MFVIGTKFLLGSSDDVYENQDQVNKGRVLIMFDDMMTDMNSNKKLSPKVTKLFLRGRKLNIYLVLKSQSYFKVSKTIN